MTDEKKPPIGIADLIQDGFGNATQEELEAMVATGVIYHPYVPLQVSKVVPTSSLSPEDQAKLKAIEQKAAEERKAEADAPWDPNDRHYKD